MSGRPDESSVASWRVAFATSPSRTRPAVVKFQIPLRTARALAASWISSTTMPSFLSLALTALRLSPSWTPESFFPREETPLYS